MAVSRESIFVMGESPMVEEFATECLRGGYAVTVKLNQPSKRHQLPSGVRKTSSVPRKLTIAVELTNRDKEEKKRNLILLEKSLSRHGAILSSSVTVTASEQASWMSSPERLMGFAALPTLLSRQLLEIAPTVHTSSETVSIVRTFLQRLGKEIAVIQDRIGLVLPRILCMLMNEASFAVMENVAHPHDIDAAMTLGTNYPLGPIAWADKIGIGQVFSVLQALHDDLGEERYRISPLLRQMATGKPWWPT